MACRGKTHRPGPSRPTSVVTCSSIQLQHFDHRRPLSTTDACIQAVARAMPQRDFTEMYELALLARLAAVKMVSVRELARHNAAVFIQRATRAATFGWHRVCGRSCGSSQLRSSRTVKERQVVPSAALLPCHAAAASSAGSPLFHSVPMQRTVHRPRPMHTLLLPCRRCSPYAGRVTTDRTRIYAVSGSARCSFPLLAPLGEICEHGIEHVSCDACEVCAVAAMGGSCTAVGASQEQSVSGA